MTPATSSGHKYGRDDLMRGIEKRVEEQMRIYPEYNYPEYKWTIGVTNDERHSIGLHKAAGKDTKLWSWWRAESLAVARDVEKHFMSEKGWQSGTSEEVKDVSVFVYIF